MQSTDLKQLFPIPWAYAPDDDTINDIPQKYGQRGRASLEKGFALENQTPLAEGGIPPYGGDMNGILKMITTASRNYEAGKVFPWSQEYANSIGGYPKGSVVVDPGNAGILLISLKDNNSDSPAQKSGSWWNVADVTETLKGYLPLSGGTLSGNLAVNGDTTLTDHTLHILSSNQTENGEGLILGAPLHFQVRGVEASVYVQEEPGIQTQLVFGVKGGRAEPTFFSLSDNGTFQTQSVTVNDGQLTLAGSASSNNISDSNIGNLVNLTLPNRNVKAWMNVEEIVGQRGSIVFGIEGGGETKLFRLDTKGEMDANGDYFAKRREIVPKAGGEITGLITRQGGGVLPEVMMNPGGRVVIQTFQVTGNSNGQTLKITFPIPFSLPPTGLFFTANHESTGDGAGTPDTRFVSIMNTANNTHDPAVTNMDVQVTINWVSGGNSVRPHTIWVMAVGVMN